MQSKSTKKPLSGGNEQLNIARVADNVKLLISNLPMEILNDLEQCFKHYDTEGLGYINIQLFKNILTNFGFHKMQNHRETEMELMKTDPEYPSRNAVSLRFC